MRAYVRRTHKNRKGNEKGNKNPKGDGLVGASQSP